MATKAESGGEIARGRHLADMKTMAAPPIDDRTAPGPVSPTPQR